MMAHNNYFQFKQFIVNQNRAAMRVGTDGVLLGAWVNTIGNKTILDIGTGTGLIALMIAQRNSEASVVGIDIDFEATLDAYENFQISPWHDRLSVQCHDILTQEFINHFDLVVCNPPFFSHSSKAVHRGRNLARHTDSLPHHQLIAQIARLLMPTGRFAVIIPIEDEKSFRDESVNFRLFPTRITRVRPNHLKPLKRVLLEFSFESQQCFESELCIETEIHHQYTHEFIELVKPFYLYL